MKKLLVSQVPEEVKSRIGASRYVLLDNSPFAKLVAFGDDPVAVQRGNKALTACKAEGLPTEIGNPQHHVIPGTTLYRIDEE